MRYKGQRRSIPEVARELNVDAVVEGSVRRAGDRVRITVQLIDAATERHLWAKSYERDVTEVLALQGEVAAAIVAEIRVTVTPQEATLLQAARTVNPEAYEAFLKGRYFIERRTEEALRQGLACLDEAVKLDSTLGLAHVGVADAYNLMGFMTVIAPREAFPRAMAAARRALEIDPACAEALTSLAYGVLWHEWDHVEAERLFRKSIDLNPRYSQAHLWFANELILSGHRAEARAEAQMARTLDPLSNVAIAFNGWFPYWEGLFEVAIRGFLDAVELIPEFAPVHYWLGLAYMRAGHDAEAIAALGRCVELLGRTPMAIAALGTAHALAGRTSAARAILEELAEQSGQRHVGSYYPAQVHVALGDRDAAFALLDAAFEERAHWLAAVRIDPSLAALRGDSRYDALVARVESSRAG
jgi:tetratricopeptide (TPR) repeat protein